MNAHGSTSLSAPADVAAAAKVAPVAPPRPPNPYIVPAFITCILITGHLTFGILESYSKTVAAILVSIAIELVLGRLVYGKWPHPASAYITGISVGILIRSPAFWPFVLCAAISIVSK
jgi:hypothetical protein